MTRLRTRIVAACVCAVGLLWIVRVAALAGQAAPDVQAPITALQRGGCVVVMRHASAPLQPPSKDQADPENRGLERQLDERGRAAAVGMGSALRRLKIAVGDVWSSPTYRARETARLAELGAVRTDEHLGDGGSSMQGATDEQAAWLRARVAEPPRTRNVFLITHQPNVARAFPNAADLPDGGCLVFRPDGRGGTTLVGRIRIEDWPTIGR
jgi:phosphohistidine phosphatase SixA